MTGARTYSTTVAADEAGHVYVPVPFDPDATWGPKPSHHIAGTVAAMGVRGVIATYAGERGFVLGPAWRRHCGLAAGDAVEVVIEPEGLQRTDLPDDLAAALEANPTAGAFFDSLAQFYRTAYVRWIEATKRRPDQRPVRITEVIDLLDQGVKERPKP